MSLNALCLERLGASSATGQTGPAEIDILIPAELRLRLIERWPKQFVGLVLFGSAARGEATPESDIDLLLVLERGSRLSRKLYSEWDELVRSVLTQSGGREISPQFVRLPSTPLEGGGLWFEAALEGIVLWERGRRVSQVIRSIREAMARGLLRRETAYGQPYWMKGAPAREK